MAAVLIPRAMRREHRNCSDCPEGVCRDCAATSEVGRGLSVLEWSLAARSGPSRFWHAAAVADEYARTSRALPGQLDRGLGEVLQFVVRTQLASQHQSDAPAASPTEAAQAESWTAGLVRKALSLADLPPARTSVGIGEKAPVQLDESAPSGPVVTPGPDPKIFHSPEILFDERGGVPVGSSTWCYASQCELDVYTTEEELNKDPLGQAIKFIAMGRRVESGKGAHWTKDHSLTPKKVYPVPPERQGETSAGGRTKFKFASETPVLAILKYECPCAPVPRILWFRRKPAADGAPAEEWQEDAQEFVDSITVVSGISLPLWYPAPMSCWIAVMDTPTKFFMDPKKPQHVNIDLKAVGVVKWLVADTECKDEEVVKIKDGTPSHGGVNMD